MGFLVSPGHLHRERDFSLYAPQLSTTSAAVLGLATKGPVGKAVHCPTWDRLRSNFGPEMLNDQGIVSCEPYFAYGRQLFYVRVSDGTHTTAQVNVRDSLGTSVFVIEAESPGTWANDDVRIVLTNGEAVGTFQLHVELQAKPGVWDRKESYYDFTFNVADGKNFIENILESGRLEYGESASQYIRIDTLEPALVPVVGTYTLVGGTDGIDNLVASDYIGDSFGGSKTGLSAISNPDLLDINLLIAPGIVDPAYINEAIHFCENIRRDCMTILDTPYGLDPSDAVDFMNGAGSYVHQAFNSSYAAMYYPWLEVNDSYNKLNRWVAPSGHVMAQYAYNDFVAFPWFAPAGYNRGLVKLPIRAQFEPEVGDRDLGYQAGNNLNMIITDPTDGLTILGQKTLQRAPTARDRVNVRRLLLYIEKVIATSVKYLIMEPNDKITWDSYKALVKPVLDYCLQNRGLEDFRIICDETTNPPLARNRSEMYGKIGIIPQKAAEFIYSDFVLFPSGASFEYL